MVINKICFAIIFGSWCFMLVIKNGETFWFKYDFPKFINFLNRNKITRNWGLISKIFAKKSYLSDIKSNMKYMRGRANSKDIHDNF